MSAVAGHYQWSTGLRVGADLARKLPIAQRESLSDRVAVGLNDGNRGQESTVRNAWADGKKGHAPREAP